MLRIYPVIKFKLDKNFQREYLYSSTRLAVLVYTNMAKYRKVKREYPNGQIEH